MNISRKNKTILFLITCSLGIAALAPDRLEIPLPDSNVIGYELHTHNNNTTYHLWAGNHQTPYHIRIGHNGNGSSLQVDRTEFETSTTIRIGIGFNEGSISLKTQHPNQFGLAEFNQYQLRSGKER